MKIGLIVDLYITSKDKPPSAAQCSLVRSDIDKLDCWADDRPVGGAQESNPCEGWNPSGMKFGGTRMRQSTR